MFSRFFCVVACSVVVLRLAACSSPETPAHTTPSAVPTSELPAHCTNRGADSSESDVDCGGPDCPPCGAGRACLRAVDCASGTCIQNVCLDPSCANQLEDTSETDVDCGGSRCKACEPGQGCLKSRDCTSLVCTDSVCAAPSCEDAVKNGAEIEIDCGASGCPGCHTGAPCSEDNQCSSEHCEDGHCAVLCQPGTAECDHVLDFECETKTTSDPLHCGGCDQPCALANAKPSCVDSVCRVSRCEDGYRDCNGVSKDGCEINAQRDPDHCGECDATCSRIHADATCVDGVCAITCELGFGDCDRDANTGCETSILDNVEHCGGCNRRCPASRDEAPLCVDGECTVAP